MSRLPRRRRRRHRRRRHDRCADLLRAARLPGARVVAVRLRALGRARSSTTAPSSSALADDDDRRLRRRAVLRRRRDLAGVGAALRRRAARSSSTTPRAWRMDPDVPLVVSEVNPDALDDASRKGIVANPNCTTMVVMLPLKALHDAFGLTAMVATSFQAAGGAGQKGIDELAAQVAPLAARRRPARQRRREPRRAGRARASTPSTLAFNVVPLLGTAPARRLHRRGDEAPERVAQDPRIPDLAVSPTCVRVPVMVGHSIEVRATFEREPSSSTRRWRRCEAFPNLVRRGGPDAAGVGGPRRDAVGRVRARPRRPRALAELLRRRRQPAQGRGAEHRADRRAAVRARAGRPSGRAAQNVESRSRK